MTILFTRSIDFTHKQTLREAGFEVLEYDFLKTQKLPYADKAILNEIQNIKNLVFTSQNAVRIFYDALTEAQLSKSFKLLESYHASSEAQRSKGFKPLERYWASDIKIFSTSGATKDLIEKYGITPTLSADSAKQLANEMLDKIDLSQGVHFINGTLSLPHLPNILTKKGISVKTITVYETVLTPLSIGAPSDSISFNFDSIVFLSLSAAESFLLKNTLPDSTPVFTLGQTTADYVRKNTNATNIFVAEKPTIAAIVSTILQCFKGKV
jgi:uroporphyrinogen-III synthase